MRILLVCAGGLLDPGGVTRSMEYLVAAARTIDPPPRFTILDPRGPGSVFLSPIYFIRALFELLRHRWRRDVDVVHVNMAAHASTVRKLALITLCRFLRLPTVLHLHGSRFADFFNGLTPPWQRMVRRAFNRASRVVVLGDSWRAFVCDRVGIDPERVVVLRNAVPVPDDVDLSERGNADEPVRLLFLGRLGSRKGVPELLAALNHDAVRSLSWRAIFAGDGEVEKFRAQASALALAERISFTGWIDEPDVVRLLRGSDVLVLPSHNEGLPMAILEAMAHGLAVVTTPVGAIAEVIVDGETGLLVPPGQSTPLADALKRVITDNTLRLRLATVARRYAEQELDVKRYAVRFLDVYQAAIAEDSHRVSG